MYKLCFLAHDELGMCGALPAREELTAGRLPCLRHMVPSILHGLDLGPCDTSHTPSMQGCRGCAHLCATITVDAFLNNKESCVTIPTSASTLCISSQMVSSQYPDWECMAGRVAGNKSFETDNIAVKTVLYSRRLQTQQDSQEGGCG